MSEAAIAACPCAKPTTVIPIRRDIQTADYMVLPDRVRGADAFGLLESLAWEMYARAWSLSARAGPRRISAKATPSACVIHRDAYDRNPGDIGLLPRLSRRSGC